ncbi:DUF4397 domain-containing protein [Streptomyces thermocarboxydus]|uniref:DUF4397 domain-containing protein n=1 Tax=Streptomyces thermocarboxydus TaxID=59299 RepID=UPI0025CA68A7|nr:DUF4397 domain-containing protein [Streptomyces thermocarboxydus]
MRPRFPVAIAASTGACALALGVAAPAMAAPSAEQETAMVSVVHGIPGMTADVYANGDELLAGFEPGTVTEPQSLTAGSYDIQIFEAGQGPDGKPALEKTVEVGEGDAATIAAHLSADGKPQLTAFADDVSKVDAGKGRLTVRHIAAAPAVDVRAGGQPVFTGLTNPNEDSAVVDAGTVDADVVLAGTDTVAIGPAEVNVAEGAGTVVYAWGSAEGKNLALATQKFSGMDSMPKGVHAGGGAAVSANSTTWTPGWAAAGGAVAVAGVLAARRFAGKRG